MVTVSLCMIVKNEEETLGRCLESVKDISDEIIIVDTGSTDNTKEIASKYTDKIYDFEWQDDFAAARNYSFFKATKDYILWLDADDIIREEDRLKFIDLKKSLKYDIDVVMMKYDLGIDNNGNPTMTFYRERLLKRSKNFVWYEPVHEYLAFSGKFINADIAITHKSTKKEKSDRNLKIFEKMLAKEKQLSDRNTFYYARELFLNERYDEAKTYYNKFLDIENGYISNYIDACIDLSKIYKMKNEKKLALRTLYRSFEFDTPKAEILCQIGYHYKKEEEYKKAIFWFDLATKLRKPEGYWGFVIPDCWGFIPNFELSVLYSKLNEKYIEKAKYYNEKAAEYKPEHPIIMHNRKIFNKVLLKKIL